MKTIRLTMAQALVRFLDNQYLDVDGTETKFVRGVFGIFGHGNVVGLGEALVDSSHGLTYYQGHNEQGMAHAAIAYAKQMRRRQICRRDQLDRAGGAQHGHGGGNRHGESHPGAAPPRRHLRLPTARPGAPAGGAVLRPERDGERRLQGGQPVLGSDRAAGAADERLPERHARAHRSGRDRRGHPGAPAGRPGGVVRLPCGVPAEGGFTIWCAAPPTPTRSGGRWRSSPPSGSRW